VRNIALVLAIAALAACGKKREAPRAQETVEEAALEAAALRLEAIQDKMRLEMADVLLKAWIAEAGKKDHAAAERALAKAFIRVDTTCGNTPACAVARVGDILRGKPRVQTFRPIGKGTRVWMNVSVTDFEDPNIASAEILATFDLPDTGDISFAEIGVSVAMR
jgi:hypothetical protein